MLMLVLMLSSVVLCRSIKKILPLWWLPHELALGHNTRSVRFCDLLARLDENSLCQTNNIYALTEVHTILLKAIR